ELGGLLVDRNVEAALEQRQRRGEAADAGADDADGFRPVAHSPFTPDDFTIAAQRGSSSAMNAAKSCADPIFAAKPSLRMVAVTSAERSCWLGAALSWSTIWGGVPAGASMPAQKSSVRSRMPTSAIVGTSGKSGLRDALVMASARSLPSRMSGRPVA